ncbi:glycosyltransferase [Pedobacter endophyticus]|uniref:Glycosyltransferase n=1 Tax=Pedobacter endophyticus TaxID=2789740 RepID=A0A7S9L1R2_9SPHI|nr:glycosyltransferase [Pedobacter endophyticus]QPH40889.1 glycosyltransferase [Pedobacter endophyticus]
MNIGIIAHLKHPIKKPFMGGLEAFTYEITKRLAAKGHQVTLYASEHSDPDLNVSVILSDIDYDRETFSRFRSHELSEDFISTHHAYLELMQDIDGKEHDVIFNNSLNYVPVTMATLIETPMVTVLHTPPIFELKRAMSHERKTGKVRYVSVSNSNAIAWQPYLNACEVITNGVDVGSWKYIDRPSGDYVIWFGRIHPDKGTHIAIQAAKIAGYKIKVAGSIADHHYYQTYVEPLLDDNVALLGNCDHEELNLLIGNALCSVITPCWEEPFGLVVAESLACGTPVAGIAKGALPYLVNAQTGCLTSSTNPSELAECINSAIHLQRENCRTYAEKMLNIERTTAAYEKILMDTIEQQKNVSVL